MNLHDFLDSYKKDF